MRAQSEITLTDEQIRNSIPNLATDAEVVISEESRKLVIPGNLKDGTLTDPPFGPAPSYSGERIIHYRRDNEARVQYCKASHEEPVKKRKMAKKSRQINRR